MSEQNIISAIAASNGTSYLLADATKSAVSVDMVKTDINLQHISQEDYEQLVEESATVSNWVYFVSSEYEDVYGQQVKNMAPGTDLSDAVNLEQLTEVSSRAYDTYTQSEVDQKIASAQYFKKYVVQTLPPVADADERGIYLVPSSDPETQNTYDEYVVVGEGSSKAWEKIGAKSIDLSGYKTKQTVVPSPTASGSATAFIDTVSQDENGVITATKKNVQAASTSLAGIVQLNNTLTSTATNQAATANAVKTLNDTKLGNTGAQMIAADSAQSTPGTLGIQADSSNLLMLEVSAMTLVRPGSGLVPVRFYKLELPEENGTLATKEDIPDVSSFSSVSVDNQHADVNLLHISQADYEQLVVDDEVLSNALYIVSSDYVETYGQQIKNVAGPTDLSDAVNKEYVDSNFQPAGNYLTAVPDAYKTYAATLSSLSSTYSLTSHTHSQYSLTSHTHSGYVPTSRKINGTQLTGDVNVGTITGITMNGASKGTSGNVNLGTVLTAHQSLTGYVPTSRTVAGQQLTADVTAATISSAVGLGNYSLTSHTHSDYSLTSHTHSGYVPTSRTVAGMQLTGNVSLKNLSFGSKNYNGSTALTVTAGDLGALTAHQPVSAVYVNQHIRLSANSALVGDIDCSDFIKDGMLSTVELCSDQLIFIFNAESGKTAISVALSNFIDETNYYTKAELTGATGILKGYSLTSHTHSGYVPTSRTVAGYQLTANVTAANISSAIGLNNYALDSNALHKTGDETAAGKKTFSDAFTVGTRKSGSTVGTKSFAYGANNTASGEGSFAGGQNSIANAYGAHAEGYGVSATGYMSYAIGQGTLASGYTSYAEGYCTKATNGQTHAEGAGTVAAGSNSHAENSQTSAIGNNSHSEGYETIAQNDNEHAQGAHNFSNAGNQLSSKTLDSIGIGDHISNRKNATEVMQNGDAYFLGVGGYDGTNAVSATSKPLAAVLSAMKSYADTKTALDSVYKPLQTAKTSPSASGNTTAFIDTISQDENGVITATKKNVNFSSYVPTSRKINGTQLTADINVGTVTGIKMNGASKGSSGVVDLGTVLTAHQSLTGYVPTSRTVAGKALTANITAAELSTAIGLGNYSLTSHTHSGYVPTSRTVAGKALTANITAAELSTAIGLGSYQKYITGIELQALANGDRYIKIDAQGAGKESYIWMQNGDGDFMQIGIDSTQPYIYANGEQFLFPSGKSGTLALTSDIPNVPVKQVKLNGTALTPDASGTVNVNALTSHQSLTAYYTKAQLTGTTGVLTGYSLTSHTHSNYLTAVPSTYKTYADTKTALSGDGYVTGVKVNGTTKSPSSGVVDIGTVLTAHQSLDSCLKNTGNQTISDCNRLTLKSGTMDHTVVPTSSVQSPGLTMQDKNAYAVGYVLCDRNTAGRQVVLVRAKQEINGSDSYADIGVAVDADNTKYAYCPTPPSSSNDTKIATTAWTRQKLKEIAQGIGTVPSGDGATLSAVIEKFNSLINALTALA